MKSSEAGNREGLGSGVRLGEASSSGPKRPWGFEECFPLSSRNLSRLTGRPHLVMPKRWHYFHFHWVSEASENVKLRADFTIGAEALFWVIASMIIWFKFLLALINDVPWFGPLIFAYVPPCLPYGFWYLHVSWVFISFSSFPLDSSFLAFTSLTLFSSFVMASLHPWCPRTPAALHRVPQTANL